MIGAWAAERAAIRSSPGARSLSASRERSSSWASGARSLRYLSPRPRWRPTRSRPGARGRSRRGPCASRRAGSRGRCRGRRAAGRCRAARAASARRCRRRRRACRGCRARARCRRENSRSAQLDADGAAVALDLALVGVELHPPHPAVVEHRVASAAASRGQHLAAQPRRLAADAQPQVPVRIAVADEEPAVDAPAASVADDRRDRLAQDAIGGRRAGVELGVQPLRAGREAAADLRPAARRRATGRAVRRRASARGRTARRARARSGRRGRGRTSSSGAGHSSVSVDARALLDAAARSCRPTARCRGRPAARCRRRRRTTQRGSRAAARSSSSAWSARRAGRRSVIGSSSALRSVHDASRSTIRPNRIRGTTAAAPSGPMPKISAR